MTTLSRPPQASRLNQEQTARMFRMREQIFGKMSTPGSENVDFAASAASVSVPPRKGTQYDQKTYTSRLGQAPSQRPELDIGALGNSASYGYGKK